MVRLFISPIEPRPSGNGLAMRAAMILDALAEHGDVALGVVPLAGALEPSAWADERCTAVVRLSPDADDAVASVADPRWRGLLQALDPRPAMAEAAWPAAGARLAAEVSAAGRFDWVVGLRSYVAPLAIVAATALEARLFVDLDDDDVGLASDDERSGWERLVSVGAEHAAVVTAASPAEADALSARLGRPVATLVNVHPPVERLHPREPGSPLRIGFVGNLTYWPNRDAVDHLIADILPHLDDVEVVVAGTLHAVDEARWSVVPGLTITGEATDITAFYESIDVAVVPLRAGAGTRIKVLEAMAVGRPVVATPTAVAGLDVRDGEHALVRDSAEGLADALEELRDADRAAEVTANAHTWVRRRHGPETAGRRVAELLAADGDQDDSR